MTINKIVFLIIVILLAACKKEETIVSSPTEEEVVWLPSKTQQVIILKQTGTWCSACPKGAKTIASLEDSYGDKVVPIAIHGPKKDPMKISCFSSFRDDRYSTSYPSLFITETKYSTSLSKAKTAVDSKLAEEVTAAIAVKKTITENEIMVETKTQFYSTASGDYYLSVYLLENDINGGSGAGDHKQSGGSSDYKHQHVLRDCASGANFWGEQLVSNPEENSLLEKTVTFSKNSLWVEDNLHVVAILWKYNNTGQYSYTFVNAIRD